MNFDCFDIFKSLVKENIKIRHDDYILNNPTEIKNYHITPDKYTQLLTSLDNYNSIQHILHDDSFQCVFSKGMYRASLLYELLNGVLFFSKKEIIFRSNEHLYNTISNVIICSQIFGDGNHRTSLFYLKTFFGLSDDTAYAIIVKIESLRQDMFSCPFPCETKEIHDRYEKQISQKIFI